MKKIMILICCFSISTSISFGQSKSSLGEITLGPQEKNEGTYHRFVSRVDSSGIYVINYKLKGTSLNEFYSFGLDLLDHQLNKIKSTQLDLKYKNNKLEIDYSGSINNNWCIFSYYYNPKKNSCMLFNQSIDEESLQLNPDQRLLADVVLKKTLFETHFNYHMDVSDDGSKILFFTNEPNPIKHNKEERFGFFVFDDNFNLLWSKEDFYYSNLFAYEGFEVDNNGNIILHGKKYEDEKQMINGESYDFELIRLINNGSEINVLPIKFEGKNLYKMGCSYEKDLEIKCYGYYYDKINEESGIYVLKVDSEKNEITSKIFSKIDDSSIKDLSDGEERPTLRFINLKYKFPVKDGGFILIGEESLQFLYSHFGDIIVIKSSAEGNVEWSQVIRKDQSVNDATAFASFAVISAKGKLYFLFNDNPENLHYNGEGEPKWYDNYSRSKIISNTMVVVVEIDSEGNKTRDVLFSQDEAQFIPRFSTMEVISENEILLWGDIDMGTHRWAKITFKE